MSEQSIPDPELGDDPVLADDVAAVATPDELSVVSEDELLEQDELVDAEDLTYPGAAEDNPDNWQEDPLIRGEEPLNEPGELSDQTLRDETAEERFLTGADQVPPEEPTIGEAANDVDFGDPTVGDEEDASDDPSHRGGDPLADFNPEEQV
ncbi:MULTISPECIES: hypothetical protein [unclassified Arthrobacter]|uniref:hypothetical protein n=1 Tax=unclassified Arthrobacter TaxID=235627 RepID=UPI001D1456DF|nr:MULTISPECIES: hypothetical protein [unclassified Arthrobacter]MCC3276331.1 hypothetical protein [Arthrobacter sp. zg-Y20]MCC3280366.1 hypothetical protein [Arthrobacter sp. zg-Y40]MCC9178641.1 hypothetical protein [Arthrobacter sp. zg-Y750]MDK1316490.1 hypothetical protein [Arthrobacter sp. zg.Y20]MDK1328693.1 hypothetical protein [Arthrobacter sp. zg-Y1143]